MKKTSINTIGNTYAYYPSQVKSDVQFWYKNDYFQLK